MKYYKVNYALITFLLVMLSTCTSGEQCNVKSTNNKAADSKKNTFQDSLIGKIYRDATELGATSDLGGNMIGDAGYSFHLSIFNGQKIVF